MGSCESCLRPPKKSSHGNTEEPCSLCDSIVGNGPNLAGTEPTRSLFHDQCTWCSLELDSMTRLCEFCEYMRLGHLVQTHENKCRTRSDDTLPENIRCLDRLCTFSIGLARDLVERSKKCDLCHSFVQVLGQRIQHHTLTRVRMTLRTWERFFDLQLVSEDGEYGGELKVEASLRANRLKVRMIL